MQLRQSTVKSLLTTFFLSFLLTSTHPSSQELPLRTQKHRVPFKGLLFLQTKNLSGSFVHIIRLFSLLSKHSLEASYTSSVERFAISLPTISWSASADPRHRLFLAVPAIGRAASPATPEPPELGSIGTSGAPSSSQASLSSPPRSDCGGVRNGEGVGVKRFSVRSRNSPSRCACSDCFVERASSLSLNFS